MCVHILQFSNLKEENVEQSWLSLEPHINQTLDRWIHDSFIPDISKKYRQKFNLKTEYSKSLHIFLTTYFDILLTFTKIILMFFVVINL